MQYWISLHKQRGAYPTHQHSSSTLHNICHHHHYSRSYSSHITHHHHQRYSMVACVLICTHLVPIIPHVTPAPSPTHPTHTHHSPYSSSISMSSSCLRMPLHALQRLKHQVDLVNTDWNSAPGMPLTISQQHSRLGLLMNSSVEILHRFTNPMVCLTHWCESASTAAAAVVAGGVVAGAAGGAGGPGPPPGPCMTTATTTTTTQHHHHKGVALPHHHLSPTSFSINSPPACTWASSNSGGVFE